MTENRSPITEAEVLEGGICATILETVAVGILAIDKDGRILLTNRELESMLGYSRAELLGSPVELLVPDGLSKLHLKYRDAFIKAPNSRLMGRGRDVFARCRDGLSITVEIALRPIATPAGLLIVASIVDVSERRRLQELTRQASEMLEIRVRERTRELESALRANRGLLRDIEIQRAAFEQMSREDSLTALSNRREFEHQLGEEILRADRLGLPLSLALMDIDHFKDVNDQFGHTVGDLALQRAAGLIRENARNIDFAARYGGEEFALIMPGTGIAAANEICQCICKAFRNNDWKAMEPGLDSPLTISIGVSQWHAPLNWRTFVSHVDGLLYAAKRGGRDQVKVAADSDPGVPGATAPDSTLP